MLLLLLRARLGLLLCLRLLLLHARLRRLTFVPLLIALLIALLIPRLRHDVLRRDLALLPTAVILILVIRFGRAILADTRRLSLLAGVHCIWSSALHIGRLWLLPRLC